MPRSDRTRSARRRWWARPTAAAGRAGALLATATAVVAVGPSPAQAEEVFTSQAAAARATESTWIPAPARPAAVCIVDTGNDVNPDTSNVIARLATDGGDGGDLDTTGHHGTLMSMIASAPYNGFGMVGIAPSVKVVSVRATREGGGYLFSDVLKGIQTCINNRITYNIKVVSLSLGIRNTGPLDEASAAALDDYVSTARRAEMSVVAAAGNRPGAVDYPAAIGPVLAVGAVTDGDTRCSFAASGPEIDLWASGCPIDGALPDGRPAWASGSSESAVVVAAALAQLRGLLPGLSMERAEDLLIAAGRPSGIGPRVDIDAAFRAAGLAAQLTAGGNATPSLPGPTPTRLPSPSAMPEAARIEPELPSSPERRAVPTAPGRETEGMLPRPRVRSVRYRDGRVVLVLANRPSGAHTAIWVGRQGRTSARGHERRLGPFPGDRVRTGRLGRPTRLSIRFVDPARRRPMSAALQVSL